MAQMTEDGAALLLRRAARRRTDGSRGIQARRAWRRLVRACAAGDPVAHEAVRTAELPDTDVLELLAAGPVEPADRAAYLTLIGQRAQRQALDPDGEQLALAYWAATVETRGRLRAAMAAEGDGEAVRVVVGSEQRDSVAAMSYEDLDHLGRRLVEHGRFDELRRLSLDLPVAKAVMAARLLPEAERGATALVALAGRSARELQETVARMPRERVITYPGGEDRFDPQASFSPDSVELAVRSWRLGTMGLNDVRIDTIRIGTGEASPWVRQRVPGDTTFDVLHLGEEFLVRRGRQQRLQVVRMTPGRADLLGPPHHVSRPRRSSRGAVMAGPTGLAFADHGAQTLRHRRVATLARRNGGRGIELHDSGFVLTTLPGAGLVALYCAGEMLVLDEEGTVLHEIPDLGPDDYREGCHPALSFLSPTSLALHRCRPGAMGSPDRQRTEIWELPPGGTPRRTDLHEEGIQKQWPRGLWREVALDDCFAVRTFHSDPSGGMFPEVGKDLAPWRYEQVDPDITDLDAARSAITVSPWGDMVVTARTGRFEHGLRVHSPRLPEARELLERPLLHHAPRDLQRVRDVLPLIGDPAVRDALDALAACLGDRFGGDIALGHGPVSQGGPQDITISERGTAG
ncbi:hypothetical protein [Streptomyces sp. GESEQ-35]|uniref:hypothetical protein n=1 Tax=Streptomyces sp. GESEQ-35 TaxID=2812657 RepID=UPI001B31B04B|nr:hypothetical protein [Streptomyces sp. GESEQ-35]